MAGTGDARHSIFVGTTPEPGKGKGVFAVFDISRGTRVLAEPRLLKSSRNFDEIINRFNALSKEEKDTYMDLQHHPRDEISRLIYTERSEKILEIYQANAFGNRNEASVYEMGSRFNQSCVPNVYSVTILVSQELCSSFPRLSWHRCPRFAYRSYRI